MGRRNQKCFGAGPPRVNVASMSLPTMAETMLVALSRMEHRR